MALGDWIRRYFPRRGEPSLDELRRFVSERKGVEGYIEPQTATQPLTLLLVDRDGDHVRGEIRDTAQAVGFCEKAGIPVYDAQVIGYPERMRRRSTRRSADASSIDEQFAELERRLREEPGAGTPND